MPEKEKQGIVNFVKSFSNYLFSHITHEFKRSLRKGQIPDMRERSKEILIKLLWFEIMQLMKTIIINL